MPAADVNGEDVRAFFADRDEGSQRNTRVMQDPLCALEVPKAVAGINPKECPQATVFESSRDARVVA